MCTPSIFSRTPQTHDPRRAVATPPRLTAKSSGFVGTADPCERQHWRGLRARCKVIFADGFVRHLLARSGGWQRKGGTSGRHPFPGRVREKPDA